jgi:hypothetical protein
VQGFGSYLGRSNNLHDYKVLDNTLLLRVLHLGHSPYPGLASVILAPVILAPVILAPVILAPVILAPVILALRAIRHLYESTATSRDRLSLSGRSTDEVLLQYRDGGLREHHQGGQWLRQRCLYLLPSHRGGCRGVRHSDGMSA